MSRINVRDVVQAFSILATAKGEFLDDGADFKEFPSNESQPLLPTRTPLANNMVKGSGSRFRSKGKVGNYDPLNYQYEGLLNTTVGVQIIRDALGGSVALTARVSQGTNDSLISQRLDSTTPMFRNFLRELGGESLVRGEVFVQTFTVAQSGNAQPTLSAQIQNSGQWQQIADTAIDTADVVTADSYLTFDGRKTVLTMSDGVDSYNFVADDQRQIDVSFTYNQNVQVEGLAGDPDIDSANPCRGGYAGNVMIDVQSAQLTAKIYMDEDFTEFGAWLENRTLTSVHLKFATCEKIGTGAVDNAEIELRIPKGEFNLTPNQQGNFSAFTLVVDAIEGDAVTGSNSMARIRQVAAVV